MVSGRAAAALGAEHASGAPTASRCWHDPTLFADERDAARHDRAPTRSASSTRWRARLGVDRRNVVQPGYEDAWYYLWRERRLPVNVDPFDSRLDDELERDAPAPRVRRRGSTQPVGYVLPLQRDGDAATGGRAGAPGPGSCATSACT